MALYRAESARLEGKEGAFWLARAARLAQAGALETEDAAALFADLLEASGPDASELRHAAQAFYREHGLWQQLAESLKAEAESLGVEDRGFTLFRLARVREHQLQDAEGALVALQDAVAADPSAGPAADDVARLLGKTGRHAELLDFLQAHVAKLDDPNLVVTAQYRMGEICEGPLNDQAGARSWFEKILDIAPGYLPALEGLERVYTRLTAWDQLAAVYEQRSILAEDPQGKALQLHRAGAVFEFRLQDGDRARDCYQRALDQVADFPPSLDAMARILEQHDDWAGLALVLAKAAEATTDSNEVVSLTYRSARILADRVNDAARAIELLRRCLELSPGFLPAINLLRELSAETGAWREVYELQRLEADAADDLDRRHWRMLVAAEAATRLDDIDTRSVVDEILQEDGGHRGALWVIEAEALAGADLGALVSVYQRIAASTEDESERVRVAVRIADLAADAGDTVSAMQAVSEVVGAEGEGRPLFALSRVAESLNYWEEAQRALAAAGTPVARAETARLQESYLEDAVAAAEAWRGLLADDPDNLQAAAGLERNVAQQGDHAGLAKAHALLAKGLAQDPIRRVHALFAGHLFDTLEQPDEAQTWYQLAFELDPVPGKAHTALVRLIAQKGDADGLAALFGALEPARPEGHAAALEEANLSAEAAEAWSKVLSDRSEAGEPAERLLPVLVRLEQNQIQAGAWRDAFTTLSERLALTTSESGRDAIESKRRWLLAERLAETDEAWDFYRQLHEENPEDVEVLEALARIAGARGETGLAIQYLDGLATHAAEPAAAARYQRRIAEVQLHNGDLDAARQAYLHALDHHPEDAEALAGLKQLAEDESDWNALVGVLAREAAVLDGELQVEALRDIARVWESRIEDEGVATDSWRKVLEQAPGDTEAMRRLVALTRSQQDWNSFVEVGQSLIHHVDGVERTDLMAELGAVFLKHLHHEDEALRFLDAASQGDHPNGEAAQLFERMQAARGNWDLVVEALIRQARAAEGSDAVGLLLRAAQTRLETLHDRDGASAIYGRVLEVDPANGEALRFRGDYLFNASDLAGAVSVFERLEHSEQERDLDDFDVRIEVALYFYRFAEALRRLERSDEALLRYESALKMNPSHLPSLEAVGPLYMSSEAWKKAANVYRQILQLTGGQGDPERLARTYTNLGSVEHRLGSLDKAKKRFNKALELRPNDIGALQGIASVLFARSDWNNLLNVYNNIIYHAQEPIQVVDAYLTKGFVLDAKLNLPSKAAQHYEKSLAFNPNQPAALLRLAELALRKQDWPEAAGLADRGLGLQSRAKRVIAGLHLVKSVAHGACGDEGAAHKGMQAALEADVTLTEGLKDNPDYDTVHTLLRERLQAQL